MRGGAAARHMAVLAAGEPQVNPRVSGGPMPVPDFGIGGGDDAVEAGEPPDALTLAQRKCEELMAQADAPELLDSIFCTTLLQEIRARAAKAQVSPMLALSANLSAVMSVIPVRVQLPKLTGKKRSPMNLISVGIDESGGGKGGLTAVDIDPVPHGWPKTTAPSTLPENYKTANRLHVPCTETVGSGEAISTAYVSMEKSDDGAIFPVMHTPANWFAWDEIAKILAVRDRKGSTIEAEISQGWSGEKLGSRTKTSVAWVEPMTYRFLCSIAGQPATAAALMDNEFQGILQRMWFVSGAYRITEAEADPAVLAQGRRTADGWFHEPDDDEPLIRVELPEWPGNGVIPVHGEVAAVFERERAEHGRGNRKHPWDRHENLLALRLAVAGAAMHGELGATMGWWRWSQLLLQHHKLVRAAVQAMHGVVRQKEAAAAGKTDAARADARDAARWSQAVDATKAWAKKRKEFTVNQAVKATSGYRADRMGDIINHLLEQGDLTGEQRPVHNRPHELTVYYRAV